MNLDLPSFAFGVVFGVILLFAALALVRAWRGNY